MLISSFTNSTLIHLLMHCQVMNPSRTFRKLIIFCSVLLLFSPFFLHFEFLPLMISDKRTSRDFEKINLLTMTIRAVISYFIQIRLDSGIEILRYKNIIVVVILPVSKCWKLNLPHPPFDFCNIL